MGYCIFLMFNFNYKVKFVVILVIEMYTIFPKLELKTLSEWFTV